MGGGYHFSSDHRIFQFRAALLLSGEKAQAEPVKILQDLKVSNPFTDRLQDRSFNTIAFENSVELLII